MRSKFSLYTFVVSPDPATYPADQAARVGTFTIRATGDRTVQELADVFDSAGEAPYVWDPCETVFFRRQVLADEAMGKTLEGFGLAVGDEFKMWGGADFIAAVRAAEPGSVARSLPPAVTAADGFDVDLMQELVADAEDADFGRRDGVPREVQRLSASEHVVEHATGAVFPIERTMRHEGELKLALFPSWVSVETGGVVPATAGRLAVATRGGPAAFECTAFDELAATRLDDVAPEPIDLFGGDPAGVAAAVVTYTLTQADLHGYSGSVRFLVMGNGEFWRHRDRLSALFAGGVRSDED